jgi:hypothetical protein
MFGKHNVLADMFSRLPIRDDIVIPQERKELELYAMTFYSWFSAFIFDHLDDFYILFCFLN